MSNRVWTVPHYKNVPEQKQQPTFSELIEQTLDAIPTALDKPNLSRFFPNSPHMSSGIKKRP